MNVFGLRNSLIDDYSSSISSFIRIRDQKIKNYVDQSITQGLLWPDPLIQLNPTFEPGKWIDDLTNEGVLHKECKLIFRRKQAPDDFGQPLRLHKWKNVLLRSHSHRLRASPCSRTLGCTSAVPAARW